MPYFSEKNILDVDPTATKEDIAEGMKVTGNGKGDTKRPRQVTEEEYARNYCRTFGHRRMNIETMICDECGARYEDLSPDEFIKTYY